MIMFYIVVVLVVVLAVSLSMLIVEISVKTPGLTLPEIAVLYAFCFWIIFGIL